MKRAVVIQHVAFEDLGTLQAALTHDNFTMEFLQAGIADLGLLDPVSPELLVILGGPIGAYEQAQYPFLTAELDFVARRLAAQRPTIGICLGAQLMAKALGASVFPGGNGKEIGWSGIFPHANAPASSPLSALFTPGLEVLHWHGDTFELPAEAVPLASSRLYPNQAFAIGRHGLALQFHPEVIAGQLERWFIGHAVELAMSGISVASLRTESGRLAPPLERAAQALWKDVIAWLFES